MQSSKLFEILATFAARDFRLLGEYLASPLFNKREDLGRFYAAIRQQYAGIVQGQSGPEDIWAATHPNLPFDEKEFGYLMSFLTKQAEAFLGQLFYLEQSGMSGPHTLRACSNRGLDKSYRQLRKQLQGQLGPGALPSYQYYFHQYHLAETATLHFHKTNLRTFDQSLQETVDNLDYFYLSHKLKLSCELINRRQILNAEYDLRLVEELMSYLELYPYEDIPPVAVYRQILLILTDPGDHRHFEQLRLLMDRHRAHFPRDEFQEISFYAQNHCIRMIKQGQPRYQKELFGLYQSDLETGILYDEKGWLSPWNFKNIVTLALRLSEFDWAQEFIKEGIERLEPPFRETAFAYNQANLHFHHGDYNQALRLLNQVEFTDVFYSLDTRRIMLKIYFERSDTEALLSLIASFKIYLRRNKLISEGNRTAYLNFVDLAARIFREQEKGAENPEELIGLIKNTNPLVEKEWLVGCVL